MNLKFIAKGNSEPVDSPGDLYVTVRIIRQDAGVWMHEEHGFPLQPAISRRHCCAQRLLNIIESASSIIEAIDVPIHRF